MLNLPIDPAKFMQVYFEQEPLLCPAAAAALKTVVWRDLDELLQTIEPDPSVLQIFLDGQIDPARYSADVMRTGRHTRQLNHFMFYDLMKRGATLVLNRTEEYFTPAKKLCGEVARFTGQPTSGNSYISFGAPGEMSEGAFGRHWDTHDVFAVQWIGKKLWRLYEPTLPLPMSHQTSRRTQHRCPDRPSHEIVLEPGDLLYIPRGWWHEVVSLDCASWHFSVGTYPQNMMDYIMWVCSRQLPNLLHARRSFVDSDHLSSTLDAVMQSLNQSVFSRDLQNEFLLANQTRTTIQSEFFTELFLGDRHPTIAGDATISLCSPFAPDVHANEIAVHNGRLKLSPASRALMQFLHRNGPVHWQSLRATFCDVPELSLRETIMNLAAHELVCIQPSNQ